jgi:hypothetical protein
LREDQRNLLLLRASAEGQLHRIQHLIRLGADVDFTDEDEFTALHHAVLGGFEDCVQELIRQGSDVNATTSQGVPLNLAAQKERGHVISILLGARADQTKAISFAADHGQSVSGLTSLFDNATTSATVEAAALLDRTNRDGARDDQLPNSPAANEHRAERVESIAEASEDHNQFQHPADSDSDTVIAEQRLSDGRHHRTANKDTMIYSLGTLRSRSSRPFGKRSNGTSRPHKRPNITPDGRESRISRSVSPKTAAKLGEFMSATK